MKIRGKLVFSTIALFVSVIVLSGCDSGDNYNEEYATYFEEKGFEYVETLDDVEKDHVFSFDVNKDVRQDISASTIRKDRVFTIYVDKEFTTEYHPKLKVDKVDNKFNISANTKFKSEDGVMSDEDDWGLYSEYFIVQNYDLDTGEELEKKTVTVFSVERELDTPQVSYEYKDDELVLSWEKVSDAQNYLVVSFDAYDYSQVDVNIIKEVKGDKTSVSLDETLPYYFHSEDAQYAANDDYWWANEDILDYQGKKYGVIAVKDKSYSALGNIQEFDNEKETCGFAEYAMQEVSYTNTYESITSLPNAVLASSCDGNTVYRQPVLQSDEAYEKDGNLHIPYLIKNSIVGGEFVVSTYDSGYKKDIESRQETIKDEYKELETKEYDYKSGKTVAYNVIESSSLPEVEDELFLNDENGEYIAKNLVAGANVIDLSKDENLRNSDNYNYTYLYDMIEEIQHQNPIVLKTVWYEIDMGNELMYVHYLFDDDTRKEKQEALRATVKEVNAQILNDNMSDAQKVYAINDYILNQTVYNQAAADAIISTSQMDNTYFDASLATGVFYEGSAVCEGYASAFMLLTRDAGLESIMVTGYSNSDSDIRHAWNRVNIDDNWYLVDTTFNDSDEIPNSALLLPDEIGDLLYEEDEYYVIDSELDKYKATGDQYEYYRANGLVVTTDTAADKILELLNSGQTGAVRLPMTTTQAEYTSIAQAIVNRAGRSAQYYMSDGIMRVILY